MANVLIIFFAFLKNVVFFFNDRGENFSFRTRVKKNVSIGKIQRSRRIIWVKTKRKFMMNLNQAIRCKCAVSFRFSSMKFRSKFIRKRIIENGWRAASFCLEQHERKWWPRSPDSISVKYCLSYGAYLKYFLHHRKLKWNTAYKMRFICCLQKDMWRQFWAQGCLSEID